MKNILEIQLRAKYPPRILKKTNDGNALFLDVWAMHQTDDLSRRWGIAVKCGSQVIEQALQIEADTTFTVKGKLDQSKNPKTNAYHTFIWAESITELVPPVKSHPRPPDPELPILDEDEIEENPEPEVPYA